MACDKGRKKEEIMGEEGKKNKTKEMECKALPGGYWLMSVGNIILVFRYS